MTEVVVTGIGAVSPAGVGVAPLWDIVSRGVSLTESLGNSEEHTLLGKFDFLSDAICELHDLGEHPETLPQEIARQDRFVQFAVLAALESLYDAGLDHAQVAGPRTALSLATAICGTPTMEREFVKVTQSGESAIDPEAVSQDLYLASMSGTPTALLSSLLGIQGPTFTLSTGCVGGLDAVGAAYELVSDGDADIVIAGASEAPITPISVAAFEIIKCLSRNFAEEPRGASRPFDAQRNGFVLSEGAGFLVLENADHARARGAQPYMAIDGFAITSNAKHMTDLVANGDDLARAIELALQRSGTAPKEIDHVSAHGSSTVQNDRCESTAIKSTLGGHAHTLPVTSLKSMIGHPLSAASAIEMVICAKAFQNGFLPPTANYETPDPECDLNYVPGRGIEWGGSRILKQANGFGGLHAAMILRKTEREKAPHGY